jgi:hypothetical protein
MDESPEEPGRTGVRASIVAMKSRNGDGAKGAQEGGFVGTRAKEATPVRVPTKAKQAGATDALPQW